MRYCISIGVVVWVHRLSLSDEFVVVVAIAIYHLSFQST
jgi:hypothetical protein